MELILEKDNIKEIGIDNLKQFLINESEHQWEKRITIQLIDLNVNHLEKLKELITKTNCKERTKSVTLIENHLEMINNPCGKIKTVEMGVPAMIGYVGTSPGYRIYVKNPNNAKFYAYRVSDIYYEPPSSYDRRHVVMVLVYDQFAERKEEHILFYSEDLRGMNIVEVYDRKSIYLETAQLRETYHKEKLRFNEIHANVGEQYILNGVTTDDTPDDSSAYKNNMFDSKNHRIVIDIFKEEEKKYRSEKTHARNEKKELGLKFWKKHSKIFKELTIHEKYNKEIEIPASPDVIIFDLKRHMRLVCHPDFLKLYEYQKNIEDSLVIPKENKALIKSLIIHSNEEFKDIIHDKSGGLLAMLTGPPGTGKTLTAEAFAEIQKKPLYAVQSSQLGVEPAEIEKQLKLCFERSTRWNAILLIDEADVYVHKRTTDLKQNSVVGTFLRVLEYYPNILFMTSNRADIIDDAIISRCIMVVEYFMPSAKQQQQIWRILGDSLECIITDESIKEIVSKYDQFTGRDIKNILKLCKISYRDDSITVEHVNTLRKFIPKFIEKSKQ